MAKIPDDQKEWTADEWKWNWKQHFNVRISIKDQSVVVESHRTGTWQKIDHPFHMISNDTNAVISSINSGTDADGIWIETWSFAITLVDAQHLRVSYQRQVNNKLMPRSATDAVFGAFAYGDLHLVPGSG